MECWNGWRHHRYGADRLVGVFAAVDISRSVVSRLWVGNGVPLMEMGHCSGLMLLVDYCTGRSL
jgi:hypothetical protein